MRKKIDLLVITNAESADRLAGRNLLDDNGGDPDGTADAIPAHELDNKIVAEIVGPAGAGYLVHGTIVYGYNGSEKMRRDLTKEFEHWCGFSSRNEAYGW